MATRRLGENKLIKLRKVKGQEERKCGEEIKLMKKKKKEKKRKKRKRK